MTETNAPLLVNETLFLILACCCVHPRFQSFAACAVFTSAFNLSEVFNLSMDVLTAHNAYIMNRQLL